MTMKNISLDVITVIKNPGNELFMTLNSLENTNANSKIELNWIIIDGSEKSNPKLDEILYRSPVKIAYIREKDSGIFEAMNKALSRISSDYFIFINSGDKLLPGVENSISTNTGKVTCSQAKWHDITENDVRRKKISQFRPYFAIMPNHQSMIFPRKYSKLHYEEKWKISSDQSLKIDLWEMGALEFNYEYVSSCLVGGLSMRKLRMHEILERYRESAEVFDKHFGYFHAYSLKVLYLGSYLLRLDWKRIK
jgi:hypothetical protein